MRTRFGKLKQTAQSYLDQYKSSPASYAAAQQAIGGILILDGFTGIDNPFGGTKRSGIFGSLAGVGIGLLFIFIPTFFFLASDVNKLTATTTAMITKVTPSSADTGTDGGETCTAIAKYSVNGREYTQQSSMGSSALCALSPNSTAEIKYNPDQPGAWGYDVESVMWFLRIFQIAGAFAFITSLFTFIVRLLSIYFGWKLLQNGRKLAKELPPGTNIDTIKNEVKQNFTQQLFNFSGIAPQVQPTPPASPTAPVSPPPATPPPADKQ